jgi:hypothetical protein
MMKTLLAAFAVVALCSVARAAPPACQLSNADYQALEQSPSHLTRDKIASMSADDQKMVCQTRKFYHAVVAAHGHINHADHFVNDYLTPAEYKVVNDAVNDYITRVLLGSSFATA